MRVRFAGRPHARILRLDTNRAMTVPGIVGIYTAREVVANEYGLAMNDQPVLCGDVVRFEGDQVAIAVAETEEAAAAACELIDVVYQDLPIITNPHQAMQAGQPLIHPNHPSNILQRYRICKGETERGFSDADVIISREYDFPMQEHAYFQPADSGSDCVL
jgi:CO/xanthine dehydrogenase Mo-binding subunit